MVVGPSTRSQRDYGSAGLGVQDQFWVGIVDDRFAAKEKYDTYNWWGNIFPVVGWLIALFGALSGRETVAGVGAASD
jgi:hypothetical protein